MRNKLQICVLNLFVGGLLAASAADRPPLVDPGRTFTGPLPELTKEETVLADALKDDVQKLCGDIGERSVEKYAKLAEAATLLEKSLGKLGYQVAKQTYSVKGRDCANLEIEIKGAKTPSEIVIVGAHYDAVVGTPGADDNGSGVAALLALARTFAGHSTERTLRLVAFVNEEPPYFQEQEMGSLHYAKRSKERKENIVAMLSLETLGYYSDAEGSQRYPQPLGLLYPKIGNFIGFVGNRESEPLVRRVVASFRRNAKFPSEWSALPAEFPGVGWSDHWSFWRQGYPGVMVSDTALYRNPNYHRKTDTPDTLDYRRFARVVMGLTHVVEELSRAEK